MVLLDLSYHYFDIIGIRRLLKNTSMLTPLLKLPDINGSADAASFVMNSKASKYKKCKQPLLLIVYCLVTK